MCALRHVGNWEWDSRESLKLRWRHNIQYAGLFWAGRLTVSHVSWKPCTSILLKYIWIVFCHCFVFLRPWWLLKPDRRDICLKLYLGKQKSLSLTISEFSTYVIYLFEIEDCPLNAVRQVRPQEGKLEKNTHHNCCVGSNEHMHTQVWLACITLQACGECLACERLQLTAVTSSVKIWPSLLRLSSPCLSFTRIYWHTQTNLLLCSFSNRLFLTSYVFSCTFTPWCYLRTYCNFTSMHTHTL